MNELALFAGAGGGLLAGSLLGWTPICAVEVNAFCAERLMQRQNEGHLPPFPIWDDVRTFDGLPWRGLVGVVSGGFPCQDVSAAGGGSGLDGERSGLWTQMARIIREVQPRYAFVENSPVLTARGLGIVLGDLAEMGFDARWGVFSAGDAGARHERERLFIVADNHRIVVHARPWSEQQFRQPAIQPFLSGLDLVDSRALWMEMADARAGMDDDVAGRVERTRAIGNGQVPCVAAGAFRILSQTQKQHPPAKETHR